MSHFNFLGIPVDGTIIRPAPTVQQRPLSDLEPLIRALLADDAIVEFGWTQYTPYYNDGDPCVFSVDTPWFRTPEDPALEPQLTHQLRLEDGQHPSLGRRQGKWVNGQRYSAYTGPDEERYDRARALTDAFESEAFNQVLLDAFGDHAHITVRRDGITVDSYSHD
ncbi:hypothetical protein GCM10009827_049100 [Dactylosporangium maewongense]|uniref:Uncharacterized protein n=1 Tax=Dactylosporangium maewongense TaxID=634393 RepID=A0ABN2AT84_9ACTN